MTQYVLRAYCFGYNDENFYVCGTRISEVFEQRDQAEAAYRKAQLEYLRDIDLAEHENIFNGEEAYLRKLAEFVEAKTGKNIISDNDWIELGTDTHTEMSDDDLFEFGELGELHAYKLIAFDDEPVFHALWNPVEEKYFQTIDEGFEGFVYGASRDEAMKMIESHDINLDWEGLEKQGTLDELSDNPTVLRQFIASTAEIEYDESDAVLRFGYPETEHVIALNALLKEPIFEIRELTVAEIKDLEKEIGVYHSGERVSYFHGCGLTIFKFLAWILGPIALIATARCTLGSCDSFLGTFGDTAWLIFKWLTLITISLAVVIWGQVKLAALGRKKKKPG